MRIGINLINIQLVCMYNTIDNMDNSLEVRFRELLIPKVSEQKSLLFTKEQYFELII